MARAAPPDPSGTMATRPGWKRLWWHSYRLGLRWLVRDAVRGWPAGKVGLQRLVVPLDPWRYYELGRIADEPFAGVCLDVSSPKLLASLLRHEGRGEWLCIDLFEQEIEAWRRIDPRLRLDVQDATELPYATASFAGGVCISVLEHIGSGRDVVALSELWRVIRPGGILHLTTDVAREAGDVYIHERIYGRGSTAVDGDRVFFKHAYSTGELESVVAASPWEVLVREFAVQRRPGIERLFYARRPWSYAYGPLLRLVCPANFETSSSASLIDEAGSGVAYFQLRKPMERVDD